MSTPVLEEFIAQAVQRRRALSDPAVGIVEGVLEERSYMRPSPDRSADG